MNKGWPTEQITVVTRWDEFCMAEGATTINENGFVTVCYAEACDPEVFDLTGA